MLKAAVVILNWNGERFLRKFLPGVITNTEAPGIEVVVADNGSTDGSVAYLEETFPGLRVLKFETNYGFAEGYNLAFSSLEAEYFVLLNSDVEVSKGWIDPLIRAMDNDKLVASVMPKIRAYELDGYFEYAGAAGGFIDASGYPFCRGRIFDSLEADYGQYDSSMEVFWTTGACMMVRGPLYKIVGGLDPFFFAHFEEIDLCWRLKNRGYKHLVIPESVVYHVGGGTLPTSNPWKTYLNFRNSLFMLYKNLPAESLPATIFKRLLLDGLSVIRFLLGAKFRDVWSILSAHVSFYRHFRKYKAFRKEEHRFISRNSHAEMYDGSIVVDYFLRKKYTFLSLKWTPVDRR
ncbi:MAG TPA: glycosyltransferase family 2 protein [Bacteroidales bacterium]|nr:glycosyltransferase family 2 protein [Bacteroidales bacterium]